MKVFLCGGGAGEQTAMARKCLNDSIDHRKPCLYIPLAMEPERYDGCRKWIAGEMSDVNVPEIRMVRSARELAETELTDYSMIFLGGGNTFRLLHELKKYRFLSRLRSYLEKGGVAFGGSAGTIIFGRDLDACSFDDLNETPVREIKGLDLLCGISIACHYTNRAPQQQEAFRQFLLELSKRKRIAALPEETTLFLKDGTWKSIGGPFYFFENGTEKIINQNLQTGHESVMIPQQTSFF